MGGFFKRIFEFLFSLHNFRVSDWSRLRFQFDSDSLAWGVPLLLVLAAFGYWSYRRQSASPKKRVAMGALRAAVLVVVLLLFLRPQLVMDQEQHTPSVVAVWVDDSQSMTTCDPYSTKDAAMQGLVHLVSQQMTAVGTMEKNQPRANRWNLALDALVRDQNSWLHKLAETQNVALYTGASPAQTHPIGVAHNPAELDAALTELKKHQPLANATDVPGVIQSILRDQQGQPVSAVILMTDGRSTEGTLNTAATTAAQQFRTPVFAIPIGQADEPLNVQIVEMTAPESTFVRDPVAVKLKVRVTGIETPTNLRITLVRKLAGGGERELAKREVQADPAVKDMDVEMIFRPDKTVPDKTERFDLEARVEKIGDELDLADNVKLSATTVVDAKINALLVDGYPRWEFRYLKNELLREKTVDVSSFLVSADDGFAQEGDPRVEKDGKVTFQGPITHFPESAEELATYDVLLIGDVEPQFFSPNQMKMIVEWVNKGGGIGWIAGWQYNPEYYRGTLLEPLLPIVADDPTVPTTARPDNAPFNLVLTTAGKASNLFRFFDDPDANVRQVEKDNPPLYWYKPVLGLNGAAEVLARHPTRTMGGELAPLLVTGKYGAGRTFFSAIQDTWRWRRYAGEPLYQSYWLQVCRLLYSENALGQSRRIRVEAEATSMEVGATNHITAQITDATLTSAAPPQMVLNVVDENGRPLEPITLRRVQGTQASYQGVLTPTLVGNLKLEMAPGLPVDVPPLTIAVVPPQREFANITVDMAALKVLADRTEGKVIPLTSAGQLATLVADRSQVTLQSISEELWNKWIALVLVVGLLATEWLIRKSAGLI